MATISYRWKESDQDRFMNALWTEISIKSRSRITSSDQLSQDLRSICFLKKRDGRRESGQCWVWIRLLAISGSEKRRESGHFVNESEPVNLSNMNNSGHWRKWESLLTWDGRILKRQANCLNLMENAETRTAKDLIWRQCPPHATLFCEGKRSPHWLVGTKAWTRLKVKHSAFRSNAFTDDVSSKWFSASRTTDQ